MLKLNFCLFFTSFNVYSIRICYIRIFVENRAISLRLFWTVYPEFRISDPGIGSDNSVMSCDYCDRNFSGTFQISPSFSKDIVFML